MFTKLKSALLFTGFSVVSGTGLFLLCSAFDYDDMYKNANVWYKVSTDELNPGEIVALDMSKGYAMCGEGYVYLVVYTLDPREEMIVAFPDGGYWASPEADTTSIEIQKHFGKLEQDLRDK